MNSRDFVYWLNGWIEIGNPESISKDQLEVIKKHLHMVFVHEIDPSYGKSNDALNKIHNPTRPIHLGDKLIRC